MMSRVFSLHLMVLSGIQMEFTLTGKDSINMGDTMMITTNISLEKDGMMQIIVMWMN